MGDVAISIQDVSKHFRLYHERGTSLKERLVKVRTSRYDELWALSQVSLDIEEGQTIGILGHNGSGKSTLLKCICGVLQPTSGQIVVQGTLAGLLELGAGFQPELSGRDNVFLNGSMLGLSRTEIENVFDDIIKFSELEQFIDNQVKFYSSGMYVRLGFAIAVNVDPDILVIDEVLAVGDERFQRKCMDKIREFQEKNKTIVFVTQSAEQVRQICHSTLVLKNGHSIAFGEPGHAIRTFRETLLEGPDGVGGTVIDDADPNAERVIEFEPDSHEQPIQILDVVLSYPDDASNAYLKSGDPLSVRVAYQAENDIDDVIFSLTIVEPKGETLLSTSTEQMGLHFDVKTGKGAMEFAFQSWPLLDGLYKGSVGIQSRKGGVMYDWKEDVVNIEVLYDGKSGGLLNLPISGSFTTGNLNERGQ